MDHISLLLYAVTGMLASGRCSYMFRSWHYTLPFHKAMGLLAANISITHTPLVHKSKSLELPRVQAAHLLQFTEL